jgi:hypothetical protein
MGDFIYLITSPIINGVKIGMSSNWKKLYSRYVTFYGDKLSIYAFQCNDRCSDERQIHKHFKKYRICGEIFDKDHFDDYLIYCHDKFILVYSPETINYKFSKDNNVTKYVLLDRSKETLNLILNNVNESRYKDPYFLYDVLCELYNCGLSYDVIISHLSNNVPHYNKKLLIKLWNKIIVLNKGDSTCILKYLKDDNKILYNHLIKTNPNFIFGSLIFDEKRCISSICRIYFYFNKDKHVFSNNKWHYIDKINTCKTDEDAIKIKSNVLDFNKNYRSLYDKIMDVVSTNDHLSKIYDPIILNNNYDKLLKFIDCKIDDILKRLQKFYKNKSNVITEDNVNKVRKFIDEYIEITNVKVYNRKTKEKAHIVSGVELYAKFQERCNTISDKQFYKLLEDEGLESKPSQRAKCFVGIKLLDEPKNSIKNNDLELDNELELDEE